MGPLFTLQTDAILGASNWAMIYIFLSEYILAPGKSTFVFQK
jgi:hypothetical protein